MLLYIGITLKLLFKGRGLNDMSSMFALCSGPLVVGSISHILEGAADHDRLSSDTYKRLNLYMILYGIVNLVTRIFGGSSGGIGPLSIIAPLLLTINSIKGYGYGVLGYAKDNGKSIIEDLVNGFNSTLGILIKINFKNLNAIGYLLASWFVVSFKFKELINIVDIIVSNGGSNNVLTKLTGYVNYALLSCVVISLKDACDRNRLLGTTFIKLNFLSGIIFSSLSGLLLLGGSTTTMKNLGLVAGFFAGFTFGNTIKSVIDKKK